MFLHYFRTTEDGRVLMGSGSGPIGFGGRIDDRFTDDRGTGRVPSAGLRTLLPGLAGAQRRACVGRADRRLRRPPPVFGTVPGTRIHYGAGYTGNGVGPSWLGGQILASLVLGRTTTGRGCRSSAGTIRKLPPEPLNYLGGTLVRAAMLSVEDAEAAGRRARAPARFVASLPSGSACASARAKSRAAVFLAPTRYGTPFTTCPPVSARRRATFFFGGGALARSRGCRR